MSYQRAELKIAAASSANFEAIHARLIASEPGRRFLAEFARRNASAVKRQLDNRREGNFQESGQDGERQRDSHILVRALSQLSAASRGEGPPMSPEFARDLVAVAAGLRELAGRIETMASAGMPREEAAHGTNGNAGPEPGTFEETDSVDANLASAAPAEVAPQNQTAAPAAPHAAISGAVVSAAMMALQALREEELVALFG
jgi:hypothetical protein